MIKRLLAVAMALTLAGAAQAGEMKHNHGEMKAVMHGDLMLKGAFTRATLPNQPVAGGFLVITNNGAEDDTLVAVSSSIAERGEVHEMKMDGDTMKMRELEAGLVIPAGETVTLEPGGYHLMFMGLAGPVVEGEMVEATLTFEKAGDVNVTFAVKAKGAKMHDHSGHGS